MTTLERPELTSVGDLYRVVWPLTGVEAALDRFSEHRDGLTAEVLVSNGSPTGSKLLHAGRLNLLSTQGKRTLASALNERRQDVDWGAMVEQLAFLAVQQHRQGTPSIDLRTHVPATGSRFVLEPFWERSGASVVFTLGGKGKSLTALAMGAALACGRDILGRVRIDPVPVLVLDWEADADVFAERLHAIARGAGLDGIPPLFYRHMSASLTEAAPVIRREVAKLGVGAIIVDSLGMARGADPNSPEFTLKTFAALRSIGVPALVVDHTAKNGSSDDPTPFGSAYTWNAARNVWLLDRAQEVEADTMYLSLVHRKANNGRLARRQSYRVDFTPQEDDPDRLECVTFATCDARDVPALNVKLSLKERILAELRSGAQATGSLATELDVDVVQVRARLNDLKRDGRVVHLQDQRWGIKHAS